MRAHHAITAAVAVTLIGFCVTLIFFLGPPAEAYPPPSGVSLDISEMHRNAKNLPAQKFHDMTFVFSDGD
jgi:hypothetical protein